MSKKAKIICLILFLANVVTLRLLFDLKQELTEAESWHLANRSGEGLRKADSDFNAGRIRLYEIQTHKPLHPLETLVWTNTFTGRKDGDFEIWSWARFCEKERERFWLEWDSAYVSTYNARMRIRYGWAHNPRPVRTNHVGEGEGINYPVPFPEAAEFTKTNRNP